MAISQGILLVGETGDACFMTEEYWVPVTRKIKIKRGRNETFYFETEPVHIRYFYAANGRQTHQLLELFLLF